MDFDEFTDTLLYESFADAFEGEELNHIARKCWKNCKGHRADGLPGMRGWYSHSLIWAFTWKYTEEGDDYWRGIWEKM